MQKTDWQASLTVANTHYTEGGIDSYYPGTWGDKESHKVRIDQFFHESEEGEFSSATQVIRGSGMWNSDLSGLKNV